MDTFSWINGEQLLCNFKQVYRFYQKIYWALSVMMFTFIEIRVEHEHWNSKSVYALIFVSSVRFFNLRATKTPNSIHKICLSKIDKKTSTKENLSSCSKGFCRFRHNRKSIETEPKTSGDVAYFKLGYHVECHFSCDRSWNFWRIHR